MKKITNDSFQSLLRTELVAVIKQRTSFCLSHLLAFLPPSFFMSNFAFLNLLVRNSSKTVSKSCKILPIEVAQRIVFDMKISQKQRSSKNMIVQRIVLMTLVRNKCKQGCHAPKTVFRDYQIGRQFLIS